MLQKTMILLTAIIFLFACRAKQKEAQEIPMDTFVKMYVSVLKEDSLMKQYQKPEALPDSILNAIIKVYSFSSQDFRNTQNVFNSNPAKKNELENMLKQAIEAEAMKSLNEKETEKN